jgi:hypothetical protein
MKRVNKKSNTTKEDMSVNELAVLMMKQFERIDERFEKIDERFTKNDVDLALLNTKVSRIAEEQEKMNKKLEINTLLL